MGDHLRLVICLRRQGFVGFDGSTIVRGTCGVCLLPHTGCDRERACHGRKNAPQERGISPHGTQVKPSLDDLCTNDFDFDATIGLQAGDHLGTLWAGTIARLGDRLRLALAFRVNAIGVDSLAHHIILD